MLRSSHGDPSRVIDLEAGMAMVVTDLHGDWDVYRRYRDRFLMLEACGQADYLIFTGDLIHSDGPQRADRSLDIVLDVLELKKAIGERLIYLLGNHEFPHLYGVTLQRGERLYTPPFEAALGDHRASVLSLFDSLPFYVRTHAGVSICHAGATAEMREAAAAARVFGHSHRRILEQVAVLLPADERPSLRAVFSKLNGEPYDDMARQYLAVSGRDDPRYDDLLTGFFASTHPDFELLWAALFNRNEWDNGMDEYALSMDALLYHLSSGFCEQEVLVTGHIACRGGYALVSDRQLRLASGSHARPLSEARYLLFDVEKHVCRDDLLTGLGSVFRVSELR